LSPYLKEIVKPSNSKGSSDLHVNEYIWEVIKLEKTVPHLMAPFFIRYPSKNNNDNNYSDHLKNNEFFNIVLINKEYLYHKIIQEISTPGKKKTNHCLYYREEGGASCPIFKIQMTAIIMFNGLHHYVFQKTYDF